MKGRTRLWYALWGLGILSWLLVGVGIWAGWQPPELTFPVLGLYSLALGLSAVARTEWRIEMSVSTRPAGCRRCRTLPPLTAKQRAENKRRRDMLRAGTWPTDDTAVA